MGAGPGDAAEVLDASPPEVLPEDVYEQWAFEAANAIASAVGNYWPRLSGGRIAGDRTADEQADLALMRRSVARCRARRCDS